MVSRTVREMRASAPSPPVQGGFKRPSAARVKSPGREREGKRPRETGLGASGSPESTIAQKVTEALVVATNARYGG